VGPACSGPPMSVKEGGVPCVRAGVHWVTALTGGAAGQCRVKAGQRYWLLACVAGTTGWTNSDAVGMEAADRSGVTAAPALTISGMRFPGPKSVVLAYCLCILCNPYSLTSRKESF
jgi:hypothetical protein